jgi:hypothetical protein
LLGEKEIDAVLQRLNRLTLEESKAAVAQTLDIVYRLVKSMEVVMEGTYRLFVRLHARYEHGCGRWQGIARRYPGGPWCVQLTCVNKHQTFELCPLVAMQEIAMKVNKMERS